ncbi:MAG: hypothetical protein HOV80_36960 [Polyangiaceae bacterium]|nr:hypothetical protein [Polyangiaceae bacterium]
MTEATSIRTAVFIAVLSASAGCRTDVRPAPSIDLKAPVTSAGATLPERTVKFCGMTIPENATEIFCESEELSDLSALSRMTRLEKLVVRFAPVTDLSPLTSLTSLRELAVQGPSTYEECTRLGCGENYFGPGDERTGFVPPPTVIALTDISPLARIPSLEIVRLGGTRVKDIRPLGALPVLRILDLDRARVNDVPRGALPKSLRNLSLQSNPLESAEGLADLTSLEELDISATKLPSIPPISGMAHLRILRFWSFGKRFTSIEALRPLTELETVDLTDADDLDLSPLADKKRIASFSLTNSSVKDLAPLRGLTEVTDLDLELWGKNGDVDLAPLGALTKMKKLSVRGWIKSFDPVGKLTMLEELDMGGNRKSWRDIDLAPLRGLTRLRRLAVRDASLASHRPLEKLSALEELWLVDTNVVPLDSLGKLTKLRELDYDVWGNIGLQSFAELKELRSLTLRAKRVDSLAPLSKLDLRELVLDLEQPADIAPLGDLSKLEKLHLVPDDVDGIEAVAGLSELRELRIDAPRLQDIGPVRSLGKLERLWIGGGVTSLEPIRGLLQLEVLEVHPKQPIADVSPIDGLKALHTFSLAWVNVAPSQQDALSAAHKRVGGCWSVTCGNWRKQRANYKRTFRADGH